MNVLPKKMKILHIEDDKGCRAIASWFFNNAGHEVDAAETAAEGLQKARENTPDVIILDMLLPDMPGDEVLKKLSTNDATSAIPVIIVTGCFFNEAQQTALKRNGNMFCLLEKPVEFPDLLHLMESALPGWQGFAAT